MFSSLLAHTRPPVTDRALILLLLALCVIVGVAYLPWLGLLDLYLEEPRRAVVAANMMHSGDFLIPHYAGEVYLSKPPLFNWLVVLTSLPDGAVSEWSARLPSVLALWMMLMLFVATARSFLGGAGLLFFGAGLALSPEILAKGRLAEIDLVFSLLTAASLWVWFLLDQGGKRGWRLWSPALLLVALSFFTKREPALVFFYFTVAPYLLWRGRWRELFGAGHLAAVGLLLLCVGAWLAALASQVGWGALWQSLASQVLSRGGDVDRMDYWRHVATYPLQIWGALLPFSLALLPLLSRRVRRAVAQRYHDAALFAALAVLMNLPLYWFKGDVAVRYFLPMFPFLLLLGAMVFERFLQQGDELSRFWRRMLQGSAVLLFWLLLLLALLLAVTAFAPRFNTDWPVLTPWAVPLSIGLTVIVVVWRRRERIGQDGLAALPLLMIGALLLLRAIQFNVLLPHKALKLERTQNAGRIAETLHRLQSDPAGVVLASRDIHAALWFYTRPGLLKPVGEQLAEGDLLLLHERHRAAFSALPETQLQTLAHLRYENDDMAVVRVHRAQ